MAFPPAKNNRSTPQLPPQVSGERGPVSTGKGGLKTSIAMKNKNIVPTRGVEKNVNAF